MFASLKQDGVIGAYGFSFGAWPGRPGTFGAVRQVPRSRVIFSAAGARRSQGIAESCVR